MQRQVGIYIPGLGEAYRKESAEKYARRFMHQIDYNNPDSKPDYSLTVEKLQFNTHADLYTQQITIWEEKNGEKNELYRFYEYQYANVLTASFEQKNVFLKSLTLFGNVIVKLPMIIFRVFYTGGNIGYRPRYRGEAFFLFLIFFIMSLAVLFLLPAAIGLILPNLENTDKLIKLLAKVNLTPEDLKDFSQKVLNITAVILVLLPGANTIVTALATEFSCAAGYLNNGERKQKIHGQIDDLMEFICEREGNNTEISLHTYSFGSVIALDYLFPYGIESSTRVKNNIKGLVTIGCPFDFIQLYFGGFFNRRNIELSKSIVWINVYSLADALASNFRKTNSKGEAEYSIPDSTLKPFNINYEITNIRPNIFFQLLTIYSIKAHASYWDKDDDGQSCLGMVVKALKQHQLIS